MAFNDITQDSSQNPNPKFASKLTQFKSLLSELDKRDLPNDLVDYINAEITSFNRLNNVDTNLYKALIKRQTLIIKRLEKELKIVPKGYYQQLWMILGLSVFGLPFGVVFGMALGNMAFLGIGLPLGMAIGIAVGQSMDHKAAKEGRQLRFKSQNII